MSRHWRNRSGWAVAAVLTAALVVPVADGIAAATKAGAVPAQLVGQWTRKVTAADVKRAGAPLFGGIPAGSVWTLTIKKSGAASVSSKGQGPPFTGKIVSAGANRVHINVGFLFPNVYRWRVSGRLLTFTKISESPTQADRAAVFWGVWKRK